MAIAIWYQRIKSGEVTKCPACGSPFDFESMADFTIIECSNQKCGWNDELADFADNGWYTPPPGWVVA